MKTIHEMLTDFYNLIKTTPIDALDGEVYKSTRKAGSTKEDCVVSVIGNVAGKFLQNSSISVKIFYNDIYIIDTYYEDTNNAQQKESLLYRLSELLLKLEGYSFDVMSREVYTSPVSDTDTQTDIRQHFAILKMNFQI